MRMIFTAAAAMTVFFHASTGYGTIIFYTTKAAFDAAVPNVLMDDFESFSPKNSISPTLTSGGITYTAFAGTPFFNVVVVSPGRTNFGAGVPQPTTTSILTSNGLEDFKGQLSVPTRAIGFDAYYNGFGPVSVTYFGTGGVIGIFTDPGIQNGVGYVGAVSNEPIVAFRWTSSSGDIVNTGIDNISVASVPEPSTTALAGIGLALWALIGARNRRDAKRSTP